MVKLQDISIFFKSDCCNTNDGADPLSNRSQKIEPLKYFRQLEKKLGYNSQSLHVATITIGNKYYGSKSAKEQYKCFTKAIKSCYRYHGDTKYLFYFELTSVGQLHAHGIIYNGYRSRFIDHFNKFGSRNIHEKSYEPLRNHGYLESYIHKDQNIMKDYKPIHNIQRKDFL